MCYFQTMNVSTALQPVQLPACLARRGCLAKQLLCVRSVNVAALGVLRIRVRSGSQKPRLRVRSVNLSTSLGTCSAIQGRRSAGRFAHISKPQTSVRSVNFGWRIGSGAVALPIQMMGRGLVKFQTGVHFGNLPAASSRFSAPRGRALIGSSRSNKYIAT